MNIFKQYSEVFDVEFEDIADYKIVITIFPHKLKDIFRVVFETDINKGLCIKSEKLIFKNTFYVDFAYSLEEFREEVTAIMAKNKGLEPCT